MAAVAIWLSTVALSVGQTVANFSFETPTLSANSFLYNPIGATWSFLGDSGIINSPGEGFFGPPAPAGVQYAFLQSAGTQGAFSQTISFTLSGTYRLSYLVAGRSNNGHGAAGDLSYQVLLDSLVIGSDATTSAQPFTLRTFDFVASSGSHVLSFNAVSSGGDNTAFFDLVTIQIVPEPPVGALMLSGLCGLLFVRVLTNRKISSDNALT